MSDDDDYDQDDLEANSAAEDERGPRDDGFLAKEDESSEDEDFDPEKFAKNQKKKKIQKEKE